MKLAALAITILFALPAYGAGMWQPNVRPGQVRCSDLAAPVTTPVEVTTGDNLETQIAAACGAGPGIVELAAGTYTDRNTRIGTGGASIGGLCVIRADNPAAKPLIRATVGTARAVFQIRDTTHEIRFENLTIDGRKSSQTAASMLDVCDDLDPIDGICDDEDPQNTPAAMGIDSRGVGMKTCVLGVDVIDTVGDAFFLRNQAGSTVEASTVDGVGCDPASCPALSVPADNSQNSILTMARGVNFVDSTRVMAVDVTVTDATKQGVQCYGSTSCYPISNDVSVIGSTGITMLGSSGVALGNTINLIGSAWPQNSTGVANGEGMLVTDGGLGFDFEVALRENVITQTWGDGIRAGLQAGTPPAPIVDVSRNTLAVLCSGSAEAANAAMRLGDSVDPFERITAVNNSVFSSACSAAVRVQNAVTYSGSGLLVSSSASGSGVVYANSTITETDLTTDKNVTIDTASAGTLSGCTLTGGATITDASSGAVVRTGGCEAVSPPSDWTDEDAFATDSITSGAWIADGTGWSVTGGALVNANVGLGGETWLRRASPALLDDHCQVIHLTSDNTVQAAPGLVLRSSNSNLSAATRLDFVFAEDENPNEFVLRSYAAGVPVAVEDSFTHTMSGFPAYIGACIEGAGSATAVAVFDFGASAPSADVTTWSASYIGTLFHDGSPVVDSSAGHGLRNWRNGSSGDTLISWWGAVNAAFDSPSLMAVSNATPSASALEGVIPSDGSLVISNPSGGSFDWTSSRTAIDDCNGATAGGQDWVNFSTTSGLGVTQGTPDTVTIDYSDAGCLVTETPHVATFLVASGASNSPLTVTVTRHTTAVVAGSFPPYTVGDHLADDNWGHQHPSCPPDVSASCGISGTVAPGTTIENCTHTSNITLGSGSGYTIRCVNWDIPGSAASPGTSSWGTAISCTGSCEKIHIDKVTMDGTYAPNSDPGIDGSDFLKFSSAFGGVGARHSALIENSVFRGNRVSILAGGGKLDKDDESYLDDGLYALIARNNIFRYPDYQSTASDPPNDHMEHVALVETADGILLQQNTFVCNEGDTCNTGAILGQPHGGGLIQNVVVDGNYFKGDNAGPMIYWDTDHSTAGNCVSPLTFNDNVLESTPGPAFGGAFNTSGCTDVGARTGGCSGNTFDGAALTSSSCTP